MRNLPESKLYAPVATWLASQGYTVFPEFKTCDLVAYRGDHIVAVELKVSLTRELAYQCIRAQSYANAVYAAVPVAARASSLAFATRCKVGVLQVTDDTVAILREPKDSSFDGHHDAALNMLKRSVTVEGRVGGVPQLAGDGPAIQVLALVEAYRLIYPDASWRNIFESVPHHYCSVASMRQAMKRTAQS